MYGFPIKIMLELTNSCNLNCEYCFRSKRSMKGKMMKWDDFTRIIDSLDPVNNIAFCGMGEQLVHPQFYEAIEYLAKQQKNVDIITNGTIPIDYDKLHKAGNLNGITFSVDGTKEEVIKRVCSEYKIDKLLKNLNNGVNYEGIKKEINFVLTKENMEDAINIPSFCQQYKINQLNVLLPTYNLKWIEKDLESISRTLDSIEQECRDRRINYTSPYNSYCFYEGSPIPFVSLSGILRVCCDHFLKVHNIGNILETNLMKLYDSDQYIKFREGVYCEQCKMYQNLPRLRC